MGVQASACDVGGPGARARTLPRSQRLPRRDKVRFRSSSRHGGVRACGCVLVSRSPCVSKGQRSTPVLAPAVSGGKKNWCHESTFALFPVCLLETKLNHELNFLFFSCLRQKKNNMRVLALKPCVTVQYGFCDGEMWSRPHLHGRAGQQTIRPGNGRCARSYHSLAPCIATLLCLLWTTETWRGRWGGGTALRSRGRSRRRRSASTSSAAGTAFRCRLAWVPFAVFISCQLNCNMRFKLYISHGNRFVYVVSAALLWSFRGSCCFAVLAASKRCVLPQQLPGVWVWCAIRLT